MSETKYVRLKPYDPASGCVVRKYLYRGSVFSTDGETRRPIWYAINDAKLLKELEGLLQQDRSPQSAKLLDILSETEYMNAVEEEERRRLVQLGIMTASMPQPVVKSPMVDRTTGRGSAVPEKAAVAVPVSARRAAPAPVEESVEEPAEASSDEDESPAAPAEEADAETQPTASRSGRAARRRGTFTAPSEG